MPAKPTPDLQRWIARSLKQDPPRAKSLVMTVFGDAIAPYGGSVWLGSLIALLAPLGISERLVRTAVYRLVDEGWLEASRSGRRSQYRLSAQAEQRFLRAHQRVYAPIARPWDGSWTLVLPDAATIDRSEKLALKKALGWEGYGELSGGVLARPGSDDEALSDVLAEAIHRCGAHGKVMVMRAQAADLPFVAEPAAVVKAGWPLDELRAAYRRYTREHQPLLEALASTAAIEPHEAFCARTLLVHGYRRVQLHDPQLPLALLDEDWPAPAASALFRAAYTKLARAAERHIAGTLAAEDGEAPKLAPRFAQRFG